jgi:hypothetical protein
MDWTSGGAIVLYVAGVIVTLGGAAAIILAVSRSARDWLRPREPLIAFGHPTEGPTPFVFWVGGSDTEFERQMQAHEEARLSSLSISYLIENKESQREVRELRTGIRERGGIREHTFDECFVQILGPGGDVEVANVRVPDDFAEGLTSENRGEEFVYWATFTDASGRRWEATCDPWLGKLAYRLLHR